MKKTKGVKLSILMNGIWVGELQKSFGGEMTFTYTQEWINTPGARPISLSMPLPLVSQPFVGKVVYNFFDNLLPDNPQLRTRIQAKFQAETNQPFDLLARIGRDCVGAIQLIEGEIPPFKKKINFVPLNSSEIASLLRGYQDYPLGMKNTDEFRISIAGAQEKSAFLSQENQWCRPLKDTPTTHIFKLPIGFIQHQQIDLTDSCENEWLCLKIANAFGLPAAEAEISNFEDVQVLVVKRFDRKLSSDKKWLMRLSQEDMCQALGFSPNLKYQSDGGPGINEIMKLLLGSVTPMEDRDNFFKSQILFWLLAAIDGHAKNFSVFIEENGRYRLTPLYDVMSAYPLLAKKQLQRQKIKMAMALKGKNTHYHWHTLQRRHFLDTAKTADYSLVRAQAILEEMLQQIDYVIEKVSAELPLAFPKTVSDPIFDGLCLIKRKLIA